MNDVALVVTSCDKYSRAWPVFMHGLRKYWPECSCKLYFVTNFKDAPAGESVKVGPDTGWSNGMLVALDRIPEPILLMMVEDYWICKSVNVFLMDVLVNLVRQGLADQIRLNVSAEAAKEESMLDVIPDTAYYVASLQPSLWRRDYFKNFVRPDENVWQFEQNAHTRTIPGAKNFSMKEPLISIWQKNPITKGVWTEDAKSYIEKEGLAVPRSENPNDAI